MTSQAVTHPHGGRHYRPRKRERKKAYSYDQLQALQALSVDEKLAWSHSVIERALGELQRPSLAFSAGKDSTVLLHLLRPYRSDIVVIYGNTTIEFPECVKFARWLRDERKLNYHEAKPEVTFWWVVREYGWPLMGKTFGVGGVAHKSSRERFFDDLAARGELTGAYAIQAQVPISSACCTFLKERPSQKLQKRLGVDGVFLGILAGESRQRMFNFFGVRGVVLSQEPEGMEMPSAGHMDGRGHLGVHSAVRRALCAVVRYGLPRRENGRVDSPQAKRLHVLRDGPAVPEQSPGHHAQDASEGVGCADETQGTGASAAKAAPGSG